jgi:uncharacterized Zn-binding protein involved in type VI secretion
MNRSKMLLLGVCLVALSVLLWSQNRRSSLQQGRSQQGILGYLDARTGAFRPVPQHPVDADALLPEATVIYTGKFVYSFTITLASTIPNGDVIQCHANAETYDSGRNTELAEDAGSLATVNGSTATCTATLPYSWPLASPSTDTVNLNYFIDMINPTGNGFEDHTSSHDVNRSLPMPANGATTNINISTTI